MIKYKLRKIISATTVLSIMLTNTVTYAGVNVEKNSSSSDLDYLTVNQSSNDNILKVNVNDKGEVTYQEPVKKSVLEESEGSWGDKVYNEDRAFSWDNVNMYFVVTDRFANGETSNDHSYGRGLDQNGKEVSDYSTREGYWHGGDIKGLTSKIEDGYFDNLGTNAIWITAPYEQIHGAMCADGFKHFGYHGYWTLDYTEMDSNIGTEEEFQKFVDTAHEHGIRVVMDVVMNHAGYPNAVDANEFGYGKLNPDWKSVYYGDEKSMHWWNDYSVEASAQGSPSKYTLDASGNWDTFWGPQWVRLTDGRFGSYSNQAKEGADIETCVDGLPDFVTEGTTDPGMPNLMKTKWSASKLAEQEKEMTEFCQNYGMQKSVKTYLVKWLTDWVRNYGIDGFRCDTAKHVTMDCWGDLKKAGVQALNEWRENNPTKPGAKWKDNFWMTGECWDHGVGKDSYYTAGGFDSMINFSYQGNENKTGSALEGVYSGYAKQINSDDSFNALSYISSHDTALGARSANAGTALLLTPGGVQTYYGDESGRKGDGTSQKQPTRSNMNWDSIDQKILSNWQKVGQFRSEHIAVGAGQHKELSAEPYTFSRTYEKGDVNDKVVVSLPGKGGECEVNCGDTFEDGTTLIDYYTGKDYDVSDGKVTVEADDSGVVLLSQGQPSKKASLSASCDDVKDGKYYGDSADITLKLKKAETGTYSIDGGKEVSFKDGDTITIGKDAKPGEVTRIQLKATGSDDPDKEEIVKEFSYIKSAKNENDNTDKGLIVHAKNTKWADQSKMNIWAYDPTTKVNVVEGAKWPGEAMTKGDDGWFTASYSSATTPQCIILTSGTDRSVPSEQDDVPQSGEVWYLDGTWYTSNPETLDIKSFTADKFKAEANNDVTLKAKATGSGDISYEFFVGDKSIGKSDEGTVTWTPEKDGTYNIKVVATDKSGNTQSLEMTYTVGKGGNVTPPPAKNLSIKLLKSDAKNNKIKVGETATITAETENATGDVQYKFDVDNKNMQEYSDDNEFGFTPEKAGVYTVTVTAKDDNNKEVSEEIEITVEDSNNNNNNDNNNNNNNNNNDNNNNNNNNDKQNPVVLESFDTVQSSPQIVGSTITLKAGVKDGIGKISYKFFVNGKQVNNGSESKSTYDWKPDQAGKYDLKVEVTDESGNTASKEINNYVIAEKDEFIVTVTPSVTSCKVGDKVTFKLSTKNADDDVTYEFRIDGQKQKVNNDNTVEWTPDGDGTYNISVKATTDSGQVSQITEKFVVNKANDDNNNKPNGPAQSGDSRAVGMIGTFGLISMISAAVIKRKKHNK